MDALEGVSCRHGAERVPLVGPFPVLRLACTAGLDVAGNFALHAREEHPGHQAGERDVPSNVAALDVGHSDGLVPFGVGEAGALRLPVSPVLFRERQMTPCSSMLRLPYMPA